MRICDSILGLIGLHAIICLVSGSALAVDSTQPLCVTPYHSTEKLIRRGVPDARVSVPDYTTLKPTPVPPERAGAIRRVDLPPGRKLVALTFDLCETPNEVAGYDGEIFDELRAQHIPATFFSGGHWAETHATRFGEIAATQNFEIGNHTWTHANLRVVDDETLKREIYAPISAFAQVTNALPHASPQVSQCARPDARPRPQPTLFRFPFGACNPRSMQAVNEAGMMAIQWDVSADDASPFRSADMIVADALARIRPGSIVLAHANGRGFHTGAALPRIIAALKAKGFEFVTVTDLIAAGKPVIASTCYDARPGDTDRYDSWGIKKPGKPLPERQNQ